MIAAPPVSSASSVTVGLRCYAVPCQVSATLTAGGATASQARAHRRRPTTTVLGSASVVLTKHGVQRVVFHLTRSGRKLLAAHHGKLHATMAESTTLLSYRTTRNVGVNIRRRR
jgi:hypothetical protein